MSLKFCFQQEIHRCSELPETFEALPSFLNKKFKVELPSDFGMYYTDSDGQPVTVSSQEGFEDLKEKSSKKIIKVFITEKDEVQRSESQTSIIDESSILNSDYAVIQHESKAVEPKADSEVVQQEEEKIEEQKPVEAVSNEEQVKEVSDPLVEKLSQDLMENYIMPRLEGCKLDNSVQDQVSDAVRDTLKSQMPFIVSQIKQSLHQERIMKQQEGEPVRLPEQGQANEAPANRPAQIEEFFSKIVDAIKKFPSKAAESIDDFTQKLEGDPNVYVNGKKYLTSVVQKAGNILQIFPEVDKDELLDFVARYHKAIPVDKIAELYMIKKEL